MQVTHSNQYRQTTTTSEDLLGERGLSSNKQPAHKQGVHISMSVRQTEREKARAGVKVELSSKQSQIPPPPPQSQVN